MKIWSWKALRMLWELISLARVHICVKMPGLPLNLSWAPVTQPASFTGPKWPSLQGTTKIACLAHSCCTRRSCCFPSLRDVKWNPKGYINKGQKYAQPKPAVMVKHPVFPWEPLWIWFIYVTWVCTQEAQQFKNTVAAGDFPGHI